MSISYATFFFHFSVFLAVNLICLSKSKMLCKFGTQFRKFTRLNINKCVQTIKREKHEKDHLKRTENSPRDNVMITAKVKHTKMISTNIKKVEFQIDKNENNISFKAGQWIDLIIPSIETVGGFSVCSSPNEMRNGMLELAVKFSDHPPAYWIHTRCNIGDKVSFRVGGNFYCDPSMADDKNMLLVAGGVGINPLYSILKQKRDLSKTSTTKDSSKTTLMCSSSTENNCIYKDEIVKICNEIPNSKYSFYITQNGGKLSENGFINQRITEQDISNSLNEMENGKRTNCFICGPPMFIDFIVESLKSHGVSESFIHYEKWW